MKREVEKILKLLKPMKSAEPTISESKSIKKLISYYILRAVMLLIYTAVGLFLFIAETIWNHGLFGGGAEVIPIAVEVILFLLWAVGGLTALFIVCKKRVSRCIYTILLSCGILGAVIAISFLIGASIPNMQKAHEVKKLRSNAEVEFQANTSPGTAYNTFFFDEDLLQLSQWSRYEKDVVKAYNWIYVYQGEKTEISSSELPLSQMRYEINFDEGALRCFTDENYYDTIDFMYLEYKGQTYYFTGGSNWIGEEIPDWSLKSQQRFQNRNVD